VRRYSQNVVLPTCRNQCFALNLRAATSAVWARFHETGGRSAGNGARL